jgi:hypothetical protein
VGTPPPHLPPEAGYDSHACGTTHPPGIPAAGPGNPSLPPKPTAERSRKV